MLLTGHYRGEATPAADGDDETRRVLAGALSLDEVEHWYATRLHARLGSYGSVAARLGVDWRTVRKLVRQ